MKVLTIKEPYVGYIADGTKHYETRSWKTNYRGELYIHTAKKPMTPDAHVTMPLGYIVLKARLTDCIEMTETFIEGLDETEKAEGFYSVGRYAWKLEDVEPVSPIKAKGMLGIWSFRGDEYVQDMDTDV